MNLLRYLSALVLVLLGLFSTISHCLLFGDWLVGSALAVAASIVGFFVFHFASRFAARSSYASLAKTIFFGFIVLGAVSSIDMFFSGTINQFSLEICFTAGAAIAIARPKAEREGEAL